jgi:hypothetical protein
MSKHTITVLQDDIDNGQKRNSRNCAIALAAMRDLNEDMVMVLRRHLNTYSNPEQFLLPAEARMFALQFDMGLPVEPFKFEIGEEDE